jgi:hypothetical protein
MRYVAEHLPRLRLLSCGRGNFLQEEALRVRGDLVRTPRDARERAKFRIRHFAVIMHVLPYGLRVLLGDVPAVLHRRLSDGERVLVVPHPADRTVESRLRRGRERRFRIVRAQFRDKEVARGRVEMKLLPVASPLQHEAEGGVLRLRHSWAVQRVLVDCLSVRERDLPVVEHRPLGDNESALVVSHPANVTILLRARSLP